MGFLGHFSEGPGRCLLDVGHHGTAALHGLRSALGPAADAAECPTRHGVFPAFFGDGWK